MFQRSRQVSARRGSFRHLFSDRPRALRYLMCIAMGVPIWYSVGLLISLSPELAQAFSIDAWSLPRAFTLFQIGITAGDLSTGLLSQWWRTRRWVIVGGMVLAVAATAMYFIAFAEGTGSYTACFIMGLGCGYLSVFATATAEHFGTNLRVLVTATVTNFMRGSVTLMIPFHLWLERLLGLGTAGGLIVTGCIVWALALASALVLPETYGVEMDRVEP